MWLVASTRNAVASPATTAPSTQRLVSLVRSVVSRRTVTATTLGLRSPPGIGPWTYSTRARSDVGRTDRLQQSLRRTAAPRVLTLPDQARTFPCAVPHRSEERRVGKACGCRR